MNLEDMEKRIRVLEDIEEIRRLKYRYCHYADLVPPDADGVASLYAKDGVMNGGVVGIARGREEIRNLLKGAFTLFPFVLHIVVNPLIEVDGDEAKGSWYMFQPGNYYLGNRAVWGMGQYNEEYIREDGEWKIKSLKMTPYFFTPFDEGWVKTQFVEGMDHRTDQGKKAMRDRLDKIS